MSRRAPVQVSDIDQFDVVIDARSPSEFALDHIPGAINCPVLDDEERRIVGTIYKQQGAFEARRVGGAMVAANLARHLQERFADQPADWKPLVYCWRGGLHSGSMVAWWRLVGWDAQQLAGGYKRFRQQVVASLAELAPRLQLQVLCGPTGSAKTRLLHALAEQGAQVLDLEGLACHKGSLLGAVPGQPQPSQKAFETALYTAIQRFDLSQPVWVEAESRKIGRMALPQALVDRMRSAPCLELQAPLAERLDFLLRDYAYLGDAPEQLAQQLEPLRTLHGHEVLNQWQAWARQGQLAPLFESLVTLHYDPQYARSQALHFRHWPQRELLSVDSLTPAALAELAADGLARRELPTPSGNTSAYSSSS